MNTCHFSWNSHRGATWATPELEKKKQFIWYKLIKMNTLWFMFAVPAHSSAYFLIGCSHRRLGCQTDLDPELRSQTMTRDVHLVGFAYISIYICIYVYMYISIYNDNNTNFSQSLKRLSCDALQPVFPTLQGFRLQLKRGLFSYLLTYFLQNYLTIIWFLIEFN